jgi:hypothetical protein
MKSCEPVLKNSDKNYKLNSFFIFFKASDATLLGIEL